MSQPCFRELKSLDYYKITLKLLYHKLGIDHRLGIGQWGSKDYLLSHRRPVKIPTGGSGKFFLIDQPNKPLFMCI